MSEAKEEEQVIKGPELKPQEFLSPSSINAYMKCPRCYFYQYIAKLKQPKSIHLVKGSIVHETLEYFFKGYKKDLKTHLFSLFNKRWEKYDAQLKELDLSKEDLEREYGDAHNIIEEYWYSFERKMKALVHAGKAENESHAYYLLKPKMRELFVKSEELHCLGYIDRIHNDFDDNITIGDYKTSKKYGIGFPMDYKRQLAIYSLLYKEQEKVTPDFAAVVFLRYGEEYLLEVTPHLLRYARELIDDVYKKTRSTSIEDYPVSVGSSKWCPFSDLHDGTDEWKGKLRQQKLKDKLKK